VKIYIFDDGERIEEVLELEEVLMARRVIKHCWRDAQKPYEIRRRIDRMFRSIQYSTVILRFPLFCSMTDICRYSEQEDYWEAQTVTLRILALEAEEKRVQRSRVHSLNRWISGSLTGQL
jgi:hypothetical protein